MTPENTEAQPIPQEKIDPVASPAQATDTQEDPNWKAFREARKRDLENQRLAEQKALEKEAEVTALKAAMEAAFSKNQPQQSLHSHGYHPDDLHEESEDERIEKKVKIAIAAREEEYKKQIAQRAQQELPTLLAKTYPDYKNIVNEENGAYLEYHHPELYRALIRQPENFESCTDIYNAVKKYVPNATNAKRDSARADANLARPKSISSTGVTQPGQIASLMILSEEKKASNWERMQRTLKGIA